MLFSRISMRPQMPKGEKNGVMVTIGGAIGTLMPTAKITRIAGGKKEEGVVPCYLMAKINGVDNS